MRTEPAVIIAALGGIITAAIPLLARTFGWTDDLAAEWETLLNAALILIGVLITGVVIRAKVYAPATHEAAVQDALYTPVPGERE